MNAKKSIESWHFSSSPSITSTDSSSFTNMTPPPAFYHATNYKDPLTLENLSKVRLVDPSSTPLARYCHELEKASYYSESRKRRKAQEKDHVIESPRLLPFPYHNDSLFLRTCLFIRLVRVNIYDTISTN
jgi:hypothetical protein